MAYTAVPLIISGDPITAAWGNTYIRDNLTYLKGAAGPVTIGDALSVTGTITGSSGITAGSGAVGIVDSTGKIPAISSTYFASLSGANLTGLLASQLTGALPAISGAALTALTAANITAGGTLPALVASALTALTAANITAGGTLPALNGSALTSLNATNISSGSLGMGLLSAGDWIHQQTLGSFANLATSQIGASGTSTGLVIVAYQGGGTALFGLYGNGVNTSFLAGPAGTFSNAAGTAGHVNVYGSAGLYYVENRMGSTIAARVILIGYAG